jgi:hypothetical protein
MATTNQLPFTITLAALPVGWTGTPQELADALAERIQIVTQESFAVFTVGATEPSSDIGPWAKDGKTWYYFDSETGAYIPFVVPQESLGYQISVAEPTADAINVWFQIDSSGLPIAIKTKSVQGGTITWTSAYYLKTETLSTGEIQLAIATQIRWAARAKPNIDQTIAIDGAYHKMTMNAETIDPNGAYTEVDSRYIIQVDGIYLAAGALHFDNNAGTPAAMEINVDVWANGVTTGTNKGGGQTNVASPPNSRWIVPLSVVFEASAGDQIELGMLATDGVNTGDLDLIAADSYWSVHLIQTT